MKAYKRADGLFDVESHLVDTKPFPFQRHVNPDPVPPGEHLHDLWVRMVVDTDYVVRDVQAASDVTPYPLCREAEATLKVLIGERVASGWSRVVKERLRGAASCTHLQEMLIPLATAALQGIRGLHSDRISAVDPKGRPMKLNSCYAYGTTRSIVQRLWPEFHEAPPARKPIPQD